MTLRLIAAGLATLVLTGTASVAVATEAAAATPTFVCTKSKDASAPPREFSATEKSYAKSIGYDRCEKKLS
jgi:hypothetical protein